MSAKADVDGTHKPTVTSFKDFVRVPRVQRVAHDVDRSGNEWNNAKGEADHLCRRQ